MVYSQFPPEVLQIMTDRIGIGSLEEQNSSLHNQIHVNIMNTRPKAKYLKKERDKNLKFPQE